MPLWSTPYKPVSPQPYNETDLFGVPAVDTDLRKRNIIQHLSYILPASELETIYDTPTEWLMITHEDIYHWGINGEKITGFFRNLATAYNDNPDRIRSLFKQYATYVKDNPHRHDWALVAVIESVNERGRFSSADQKRGWRYKKVTAITGDHVHDKVIRLGKSFFNANEVMDFPEYASDNFTDTELTKTERSILAFIVLALSCEDRKDAKGSTYRNRHYKTLTKYFTEFIPA